MKNQLNLFTAAINRLAAAMEKRNELTSLFKPSLYQTDNWHVVDLEETRRGRGKKKRLHRLAPQQR